MSVEYHDVEQGSDEWRALRCGVLTASTISQIITPTLKTAANDTSRALVNKIAIERVTGEVEETFTSEKMLRGHIDEDVAREIYSEKYAEVRQVGFITNDKYPGLGYSPDGLVGGAGLIEVKSRDPHLHFSTIIAVENGGGVPKEFAAQIQAGLLVSEREWLDFISFSHGLPMLRYRVYPDPEYQEAIEKAAAQFEQTVADAVARYRSATANFTRYTETEKIDYEGMIL